MPLSESEISETLTALMKEALSLRFDSELPSNSASPLEILESLINCRKRADRLEYLYVRSLTIRGSISRRSALDTAEADDQWAEAIVKVKNSSASRGDNFSGPRERYAEADLATMEYKRKARKSSELLKLADEVVDVIRTTLTGLNNTRQDHNSWIRALQFVSTLEQ